MQKHRRAKGRDRVLKNQNYDLDPSVTDLIYGLFSCELDRSDFETEYLRKSYLEKYADPGPSSAAIRRSAAIQKWMRTESVNAETNNRLRSADLDFNILPRVTLRRYSQRCRKLIASILGPLMDEIVLGGFSGGASTSRRRTESHPGFKFSDKADVNDSASVFVDVLYRQAPLFQKYGLFSELNIAKGAVLFTVPKNNELDRCACKEPDFNMYLQKGVGNHIRRRLKRIGIDLNDQSVNRRLARLGSRDGSLATLDLSSASDSVTIELVRFLLPTEWFLYLNDIRSDKVVVDEDTIVTEMFSSMGNGFTFELESLLFYAITRTTLYFEGISGHLSVYGDDIIFPSLGYDMVTWSLQWFGFTPNHEKSFSTGPFRESCGGHYHTGADVTPFYLKRPAKKLTDLIRVANQLRKWALRPDLGLPVVYGESMAFKLWTSLRDLIPEDLWGGSDYEVDTQLVTPDPPRKRLVRLSLAKTVPDKGIYLLWQNSNWNRQTGPEAPSRDAIDAVQQCRKRLAPRKWSSVTDKVLFSEEWDLLSLV